MTEIGRNLAGQISVVLLKLHVELRNCVQVSILTT